MAYLVFVRGREEGGKIVHARGCLSAQSVRVEARNILLEQKFMSPQKGRENEKNGLVFCLFILLFAGNSMGG